MEIDKTKQEREQAMVDQWNQKNPIGTPVVLTKDGGERIYTETRSAAQMLGGHSPVIWVKGIAGCYALERVMPYKETEHGHQDHEGHPS